MGPSVGAPMHGIQACTFDCYGTLVDWEGGAASFLYQYALRSGEDPPPSGRELRDRWEEIQFEVISGPYTSYKEVLAESLRRFADERGWRSGAADGEALVRSMCSWQPFPDTRPALRAAHANGVRLVIVSNTDNDILEHTLRQLDAPVDDTVTAEDVRSYKPELPHFERALEVLGLPPEQVLHVAFGFKYDIGPARAMGMRSAWVNRHAEPKPEGAAPDLEWRDLWPLSEIGAGEGP